MIRYRVRYAVTLHVSVWVEMIFPIAYLKKSLVTLHVSVWVEIYLQKWCSRCINCHAPRERVSWNFYCHVLPICYLVTLHVSVWVEINPVVSRALPLYVTLHVSVWVEMKMLLTWESRFWSRSTWACELKCEKTGKLSDFKGHAPRERVSWNSRV